MEHLHQQAREKLDALRNNSYPGRGLVLGLDQTGDFLIQAYWIMGRSPGSRNRVFISEDEGRSVRTVLANPAEGGGNTDLTIYRAMAETKTYWNREKLYVVSNGAQTDAVISCVDRETEQLYQGLKDWQYEPDDPNFTPRITGSFMLYLRKGKHAMAEILVHKRSPYGEGGMRVMYKHDCSFESKGVGLCVTTYMGDGQPLPAFTGEPYPLPLLGGIGEVSEMLWDSLNKENRVALAVKFIERTTGESRLHIINKYEQVLA